MKTNFTQIVYWRFCILAGLWLIFTSCSAVQNISSPSEKKSIVTTSANQTEKYVKVYPDLVKRVMHVKNLEDQELDFYVFDSDGAIVLHYKMKELEHRKIGGMNRGSYVYQVFDGEVMTVSGKIIFK